MRPSAGVQLGRQRNLREHSYEITWGMAQLHLAVEHFSEKVNVFRKSRGIVFIGIWSEDCPSRVGC